MRKQSRITLGVIGLSTLTTSYLLGHQGAESTLGLAANANTLTVGDASQNSTNTQVTSPATANESAAAEPTATPDATASSTPQATASSAPKETATATPTPTAVSGTFTSKTVQYRYGQVQLEIAVTDGSLTDITLIKATTEGRGYDQAPPILVKAALNAGGSNFGNLSGATFVTQAFKQALDDALAQAGM